MASSNRLFTGLMMAGLLAAPLIAGEEGRVQMRRGTSSRIEFDRDRLASGNFAFDPTLGNAPFSISAPEYGDLISAMARVRDLSSRGLTTDQQLRDGIPTAVPPVPGLTPAELAVLSRLGMTNAFLRAGTAFIRPNVHKTAYYVFDIDRILDPGNPTTNPAGLPGIRVHTGEPTVYAVDVSIPARKLNYERSFSTATDYGYRGGWSPTTEFTTPRPHYRMPIEQYAMRANGHLAEDPDTHQLVPLQMVGPGDWYGWETESDPTLNARYSFDPVANRFRVAMAIDPNDQSPNVFPAGGHIHCGFIYDFGNPLNCHKTARSGDPSTTSSNQPFGDTILVAVDNRGRDN